MIRKLQQDAIEARNLLVDMYHVVKTKQKKKFSSLVPHVHIVIG